MITDLKLTLDQLPNALERPLLGGEARAAWAALELAQQLFALGLTQTRRTARGDPAVQGTQPARFEFLSPSRDSRTAHPELLCDSTIRKFALADESGTFAAALFHLFPS